MIRPFLIGAALALAQPAIAEVRASYAQDGRTLFSFEVPDFWTLNSGGERMIQPPDEDVERPVPQVVALRPTVDPDVWMGFFSPRGVRSLDEGEAYLAEIEKFLSRTPEITSNVPGRVAGLPARIIKGTGQRDGRRITFSIAVMDLPGPRVAIAAGIAQAGADPALVDQLNAIFASVRAAR
jgi:hypothetical protein